MRHARLGKETKKNVRQTVDIGVQTYTARKTTMEAEIYKFQTESNRTGSKTLGNAYHLSRGQKIPRGKQAVPGRKSAQGMSFSE